MPKSRIEEQTTDWGYKAGKNTPNKESTTTRIRVYQPDKTYDKIYIDDAQMQKWRRYYLDKGIKTRKL